MNDTEVLRPDFMRFWKTPGEVKIKADGSRRQRRTVDHAWKSFSKCPAVLLFEVFYAYFINYDFPMKKMNLT